MMGELSQFGVGDVRKRRRPGVLPVAAAVAGARTSESAALRPRLLLRFGLHRRRFEVVLFAVVQTQLAIAFADDLLRTEVRAPGLPRSPPKD